MLADNIKIWNILQIKYRKRFLSSVVCLAQIDYNLFIRKCILGGKYENGFG